MNIGRSGLERAARGATAQPVGWPCLSVCAVAAVLVVSLAGGPLARGARADGGAPVVAYVVGAGPTGSDLAIIDIARRRVVARVPLGGDPRGLAFTTDSTLAYIAETSANRVAVVDVAHLGLVATIPVGAGPVALAADTTGLTYDLFVADSGGSTVSVVDVNARRVVGTIPVGLHPSAVALAGLGSGIANPDNPEIYVANADSDSVSVISVQTLAVIATIPVPGGPASVAVPAQGGVAYVGTRSGAVVAVGLAAHRVLGVLTRLRGTAAGWMDYDAVTGDVYIPDRAGGVVDVLRPVAASEGAAPSLPAEPARVLPVGGGPDAVAITSDGAYGFVAESVAGGVAMLDVGSHRTLAVIPVGGTPRAVVTGAFLPLNGPPPTATAAAPPGPGHAAGGQGGTDDVVRGVVVGLLIGAAGAAAVGCSAAWLWRRGLIGGRGGG